MSTTSTAPISEEISEKPRRGRPAIFPRWLVEQVESLVPDRTARQRMNILWVRVAMDTLWPPDRTGDRDARFEHLWRGGRLRATILSELGRLRNADSIREWGEFICQRRMPTARAVRTLRCAREKASL